MENTEYTLEYFINKFEAIPDDKWFTRYFANSTINPTKFCLLGHCGAKDSSDDTEECKALVKLIGGSLETMKIYAINDGKKEYYHYGSTPKERVINYLKSI